METAEERRQHADRQVVRAKEFLAREALFDAIDALRRAVLLYAAADRQEQPSSVRIRVEACRLLGDCLAEAGEFPEAAAVYQEAIDLYQQDAGADSEPQQRICAQKLLAVLNSLRSRQRDRLYLLIVRHERNQRLLALDEATEAAQAEVAIRIGRIFQRRERPTEAISRFQEALGLLGRAEPTSETRLATAECLHAIATMLLYDFGDLAAAADSYRRAIALYVEHEPFVHGRQQACGICRRALADIERRLGSIRSLDAGEE